MVWQLIVINESAKVLSLLIIIAGMPFLYNLVKNDKLPQWNLFLISVGLFALSIGFHIFSEYVVNSAFSKLEYITRAFAGLVCLFAIYNTKKQI